MVDQSFAPFDTNITILVSIIAELTMAVRGKSTSVLVHFVVLIILFREYACALPRWRCPC